MKVFLGVDLGSTGTKAVLIDAHGRWMGAGRVATRGDYGEALEAARRAARREARLERVRWEAERERRNAGEILRELRREMKEELTRRFQDDVLRGFTEAVGEETARRLFSRIPGGVSFEVDGGGEGAGSAPMDPPRLGVGAFLEGLRRAASVGEGATPLPEEVVRKAEAALRAAERAWYRSDPEELLGRAAERLRRRRRGAARDRWARLWERAAGEVLEEGGRGVTGYGRHVREGWAGRVLSEISCHARGARWFFPRTSTVLDLGGQDMKVIQLDGAGAVAAFRMNDRCAAGCGRFLTFVGEELGLREEELGPRALRASRGVRVSSACTVFAGAEAREHLARGRSIEEVLRGLHEAVVARALGLLEAGGGPRDEFTLTGGGAHNRALRLLLGRAVRKRGEIRVRAPSRGVYVGALGAALAVRDGSRRGC